ncbi:MAG: riboflavin synthase subunit alpha [candidate division Zixibacteria bacterium RBG_16_40_9]|nr:MAG: riboflavin synthase subunit alpha [candidate division Zixibacteria bacterium RBG_16_40_9]
MFSGIVEGVGLIKEIFEKQDSRQFKISAKKILEDLKVGDSVNINGACQTVIERGKDFFTVEAMKETLDRTNFGQLRVKDPVNLERSLRLSDRLGGHLVTGHIDGVGEILDIIPQKDAHIFKISFPKQYAKLVIEKGSIAVEGISLTVIEVFENYFTVGIIPYTWENTNLKNKTVKDPVNLEFDLIGKYVQKFLTDKTESQITWEYLKEKGW